MWKSSLLGYSFIAPQMLGFLMFILGPLIAVFVFSAHESNLLTGQITFVGFGNFYNMFTSDVLFSKTTLNSLIFSMGVVPMNISLALGLALMLSKSIKGIAIFRTLIFAPVVTSAVAWAIVWRFLLQENGALNKLLGLVSLQGPNWLREQGWAMFSVIFTRVIKNVGLNMTIYLVAIVNIPHQYTEAAKIDGASNFTAFWRIKFPLLMPTTIMILIITVIGSFKVFDTIMLMTAGGPNNSTMVMVYYIYYQAFQFFETGYASGLAVILFLIVLLLTVLQWSMRKRFSHYEE